MFTIEYVIVFFDAEKPSPIKMYNNKTVGKSEWEKLLDPFFKEIELNEITHSIESRRFFVIDNAKDLHVHTAVLDIKKIVPVKPE